MTFPSLEDILPEASFKKPVATCAVFSASFGAISESAARIVLKRPACSLPVTIIILSDGQRSSFKNAKPISFAS